MSDTVTVSKSLMVVLSAEIKVCLPAYRPPLAGPPRSGRLRFWNPAARKGRPMAATPATPSVARRRRGTCPPAAARTGMMPHVHPRGPGMGMSPGAGRAGPPGAPPWLRSTSSPPSSCAMPCVPASSRRGRPPRISWTGSTPGTRTSAPSSRSRRSRPCRMLPRPTRPMPAPPGTGAGLPLLHGMPVAFKDLTDVAGVVTTHGSAALEHKPALADGAAGRRAQGCRRRITGQDAGSGVRADGLQRKPDRPSLAQPATRPAAVRAAPRAAVPPLWRRGWCPSRPGATAAARSASRPRPAAWWG